MWHFNRQLGKLISPTGEEFPAYSGHGVGVDNPLYQQVKDVGPIPAGLWDIGAPHQSAHGQDTLTLTPHKETNTYGRSGFLCHGDEIEHPGQHLASLGCVITARAVRLQMSGVLQVI